MTGNVEQYLALKDQVVAKMRSERAWNWHSSEIQRCFAGCVGSVKLIQAATALQRLGVVTLEDLRYCSFDRLERQRDWHEEHKECNGIPVVKRGGYWLCQDHAHHSGVKRKRFDWLPGYEHLASPKRKTKGADGITEAQIRKALIASLTDGDIIEEVGVYKYSYRKKSGRLDVAQFTDDLHGYEIKSDQDKLARLPDQIEAFGTVCKTLTVVTGPRYREEVRVLLPGWVGLSVFDGNQLNQVIPPSGNPNRSISELCDLLWRRDVMKLLRKLGHKQVYGNKDSICELFARLAPVDEAPAMILDTLRKSEKWNIWKECGRV